MPHHIRFVYCLMIFFILSVSGISVAAACICARGSFQTRWQEAEVVFRGTVKEIRVDHIRHLNAYDDKPVEITFSVLAYFKGGTGKMVEFPLETPLLADKDTEEILETGRHVLPEREEDKNFLMHTSLQNRTCMGYPFKEGEEYLVFAHMREEGSGNRWSLYHYPSGTYGAGGLCGGTAAFNTPEAQRDLENIHRVLSLAGKTGSGLLKLR